MSTHWWGRFQVVEAVLAAVGEQAVIRPHNARVAPKGHNALALGVGQQLVVNQGDVLVEHGPQQLAVGGLLLHGVREKEVGFVGN